jgi:putative sterol carrier protein
MAQTNARTSTSSKGVDPTAEFFEELAQREREPLLGTTKGTLRFDLRSGNKTEYWYISMAEGDVAVSHKRAAADATVRMDKRLFEGMVAGKVNAVAASLRGAIVPQGDLGLVLQFQRLFPGPRANERGGR